MPAYVTLGIAAGGAVVGTIFGVKALSAKSDFDNNPTTEHADDTERNALIADMAFGVALTLGVTGIVLLTSGDDDAPAKAAKIAQSAQRVAACAAVRRSRERRRGSAPHVLSGPSARTRIAASAREEREVDARRLRRAVGDSRLRTLGRWRWADRAKARGKQAPVRSAVVGPPSYWLIVIWPSKTFRSF